MLGDIFINSIWLGTKERGKKVPDGVSACPITQQSNGCFLWDSKYSDKKIIPTQSLGSVSKNKTYLVAAKNNKTIKENGGVKSFVFISNAEPPKKFTTKFKNLVHRKNIKVCYMTSEELINLYGHYQKNKRLISNNDKIREVFLKLIKDVLFKVKKKKKVIIIDDEDFKKKLDKAAKMYKQINRGKDIKF